MRLGSRITVCLSLAAVGLAMAACAGGGKGRAALPADPPPGNPVVRGAQDGLEMWWWVVSDEHGNAVAPLATYLDRPVPLSDQDKERLRLGGFRVVAVPLEELDSLQARLPTIGAVQRQWLGQAPRWMDAVPGQSRETRTHVDVGDGLLALEPGRLRMLLRCWIVPAPPATGQDWPAGALHVELAPQHVPARGEKPSLEAAPPKPEEEGFIFARFSASMTMPGGTVLLLVPDAPDADWTSPRPLPQGQQGPGPVEGLGPLGPPAARPQSLGELMLASVADEQTGRRTRAIVVLIARAPERFELTAIGQ